MASKKTVTLDNLTSLGAGRLAAVLVDLADSNTEVKRRLRLELAADVSGDTIAAEIGKRIATIRKARSFIDWQKRRDFLKDLDLQRTMIQRVAATRPDLALDLMWQFIDLASAVMDRVDDSSGSVGDVFRAACEDIATIVSKARFDAAHLADQVVRALSADQYGICDGLIAGILPVVGKSGVKPLKQHLTQALRQHAAQKDDHPSTAATLRLALQAIADHEGDVDAYIDLVPDSLRDIPAIGTPIGHRLLAAGRAADALAALERCRPRHRAGHDLDDMLLAYHYDSHGWEEAYCEALDATGQQETAQRLRWTAFEERLSITQLRHYLKQLPDFEDVEAEQRAMDYARNFKNATMALAFFLEWPEPHRTADLVLRRAGDIDGNRYDLLDPAARLVEGKYPLAATVLRRAMIEDTLNGGKSSRYKHAARHMRECQALAASIKDFAPFESHDALVARLRARHGRKDGFWSQLTTSSA